MPARWRWYAGEGAILAIAAGVKAATIAQLHAHPLLQPTGGLESEWYVALATQVAAGDWRLAGPLGGMAFPVSPLYVHVLAAILGLSGGSVFAARVIQAALGVLAVALVMRTARGWFGEAAGLVAGALVTAAGVVTFHEIVVRPSALDPVLIATLGWVQMRALCAASPWWWAGVGLAAALFALNQPLALIVAAGLGFGLLAHAARTRTRRASIAAAAFVLAVAAGLAPAALRDVAVTGRPTLVSSHGGLDFYVGNRAGADGTYEAPPGITTSVAGRAHDARAVAQAAAGRTLSDADVAAHFTGLALAWIREHPGDAARLFLRKLALVAHRTELPLHGSYAYYVQDEPTILRWLPIGAWCLVPLGIAGVLARPRGTTRAAYLAWSAHALLYVVGLAVVFVSGRHRLPLLLPFAVTGAGAMVALAGGVRARDGRAFLPLAAAAGVAVLTHWPLPLDDGRLEERVAMASALAGSGRTAEAVARAAAIAREHPQPGTVHHRVAVALQARGELGAAEAETRQVLRLDPEQWEAHATLGQILAATGRGGEARHHLLRAVRGGAGAAGAARWLIDDAIAGRDPSSAVFAVAEVARTAAIDLGALAELGHHLLEARRADLAEPFYLALDARQRGRADVLEPLGLALLARGRSGRAARVLAQAAQAAPDRPSVHLHLAIAFAQIDRPADAEVAARRALQLQPDYPQARAVLSGLAQGH